MVELQCAGGVLLQRGLLVGAGGGRGEVLSGGGGGVGGRGEGVVLGRGICMTEMEGVLI